VLSDISTLGLRLGERLGFDLSGVERPVPLGLGVHFVLWAAVGFFAHRLATRRFPAVLVTAAVVVASYLFELGQAVFTASRTVETDDMIANLVGVMVGTLAAQLLNWTARHRHRTAASRR
jgi:glycopeptide antibiotics resistance protein